MKSKKLRELISWLLCLCMVTGLLPTAALAADAPAITTEALETATVGVTYSAELTATASDPNGELTWEVTGLPNGLALTGSGETAALLGTPTEAGTFIVTVTVTESIPAAEPEEPAAQEAGPDGVTEPAGPTVLTGTRTYTLTVAEAVNEPISEPINEPINEPVNEPVSNDLLTTGDTDGGSTRGSESTCSIAVYNAYLTIPGGIGYPTEAEITEFAIGDTIYILGSDFSPAFSTLGYDAFQLESLGLRPAADTSGYGTIVWTSKNGGSATGRADTNKLSSYGLPLSGSLSDGEYRFVLYVSNGRPYDGGFAEATYVSSNIITIGKSAGTGGSSGHPTILTTTLPDATVGVSYEATLAAAPATDGTLTWALASGSSLPNGLQLDTNTGKIFGTPTEAAVGNHTFTVQVTETTTDSGDLIGTKELILTVKEPAGPTINTTELPLAFIGKTYSTTLNATAGSDGSLSWSITSGNQPEWLTLDGATGALSGTVPDSAATGPISLTFQVTEALGGGITRTAEKTLALTVTKKLEITNTVTSFNPTRGQTFSLTLEANLEDVTWSQKSGSLPSNLNLTGNTISGTVSAYERDGEYTCTVTARSQDGQEAEKTFIFTVGSLFCFTLPADLDDDAIGRSASLKATLDSKEVTLWSGKLTGQGQTLTVNSAYAGKTVTDVKLTTYLNRGDVTLATAGSVTLTDGQTGALTAETDPIITLPEFAYGELDGYVSAWFADSSGWRYNSGDLAASSETFTLKASANAYQYRSNGGTGYDLYGTPSFSGNTGVSGDAGSGYTYTGGSGGDITVAYPELTKQTVTFTFRIMDGATPGTEVALSRASLNITQYVNGSSIRTTAQIKDKTTATAELYIDQEANLSLLSASGCYLKDPTIQEVENENTVEYYTSEHTRAALLITPKLVDGASDDLLPYANNLTGSKLSPTITVGSESWKINSVQAAQCAGRSQSSNIWNYSNADNIAALAKGSAYSISWPAYQGLLAGELENQTWPEGQLNDAVEVNINLKGGVLLSAINFNKSFTSLQDWWYYTDEEGHGTWITSGRTTSFYTNSAKPVDYSFYCPGDNGTYGFLLLPKEAQPIGMTWEDAVAYFEGMPYLENVDVKDNTVTTGTAKIDSVKTANARYLTLPNSTLSGPAQFTSVDELLSFTGGIQLDKGVDGKLTSLRIDAAGDDHKVAFQISSLQINGKSYPYAGIHLQGHTLPEDTLKSQQFTTYYQIDFSEPISLPCTFTVYGTAMTANSDVKLSPSVKLTDEKGVSTTTSDEWQPLGTVTAQAPALSVSIPASTGLETVPAYLTIPGSGGTVDIYDGETLVVSGARKGEVEIPLEGTNPGFTTSHNLSFRWNKKPTDMKDVSDTPYEVMVLHTNGLPTLVSQQLQISNNPSRGWSTCSRDQIYGYTSATPPYFRAVCEIAHYDHIKGGITFLFQLLDGTTVTQTSGTGAVQNGEIWRITSKEFKSNSPVIGVSVLFEVDWTKVNQVLLDGRGNPPADSPTNNVSYNFDQTIVLDFYDYMNLLPDSPKPEDTWTTEQQTQIEEDIEEFRQEVERIYTDRGGSAGYYIIGDGSEYFCGGRQMIEELNPGVLPEGYTGETTFTRPLTIEQLQGELGGGEGWSRITFTEPGSTGSGTGSWGGGGDDWTTGLEIYTTEFTTDSGVSGTITITRTGDGTILETGFATARGTGTGGGQPAALPTSGTINPGEGGLSGRDLFSFTTFEGPTDMEVFSNWCDDTNAGAGITGSLLEILGMEGSSGFGWKLLGGVGNVLGASKSINDGLRYSSDLSSLHSRTLDLLNSPCAQKLSSGVRNSLQSQIERFSDMAIEAMAWNAATTLGGTGTGLAGAAGIMSNPWTAFTAGVALLGGSLINRQQTVNVQREAQLIQDNVDFQITKYAITNNDEDCMPDKRGRMDSADRGSGGGGYGTGSGRGGSMSTYRVCIDPSGIVYEAVLSNPVVGATVTLYTDESGYTPAYSKDSNGVPVMVNTEGSPATPINDYSGSGKLTTPVDSTIPAETVLTTGADGRFQWMVEQGLWYVTASKDGYESGDSGSDIAAVVTTGTGEDTIKWLPVAPEQTNVNIPLISYAAPTVTVEAREDGVYLTFSKYMDESTLKADGAFELTDSEGKKITITDVELLNREKAPSNIKYGGEAPSYTSQVKLVMDETLSGEVTVAIANTVVSYAGVPCGSREVTDTVSEGTLVVEAPKVTGASAGQVEYGDTVTLTIPEGATVYYTTDGSTPSATNGTRYYANQPIVITKTMTLKAVAVKYGKTSGVTSAAFTVSGTGGDIPGGDDTPTTPVTPVTPGGGSTGGSEDSSYSISVPASSSIRGGSISVSPRSADKGDTVTITVTPDDGYELDTLTVATRSGSELALTSKGSGRYTFTMPASDVKIQVSFRETATQAVNPFTDVSTGAYYYDAVLWAVANGVTNGTTATTFSPNATVTRAQMVTFLWRAHGAPRADGANPFTDVSAGAYYYDAVLWAVANGITNGTTATTFSPDAPVTRAQAVTFQWRTAGSPAVSGGSFSDVAASAYYSGAVAWAVANGITNGTTATTFSPDTPVSRAQAVTFLYRELA